MTNETNPPLPGDSEPIPVEPDHLDDLTMQDDPAELVEPATHEPPPSATLGSDVADGAAAGASAEGGDDAMNEDHDAINEAAASLPETAAADPVFTDDDLLNAAAPSEFEPAVLPETAVLPEPEVQTEPESPGVAGAASPDGASGLGEPTIPPPPHQQAAQQDPATAYPPGYGVQPPRRLYRSTHDQKLGGVFAGIAEYFNIDPTIVRLLGLLLALTGVGFVLYFIAWLIVPERPAGEEPFHGGTPIDKTLGVAAGIAAAAVVFGIITDSAEVFAVALILGGIWLLSDRRLPVVAATAPAAAPATSAPAYGAAPHQPMAYVAPPRPTTSFTPPPPAYFAPTPRPARPPRQPQRVTAIVMSLLLILVAVGALAASGDWWDVSVVRLLGIGVVIIGVGVVVGQIRGGGARGLIPLGILAALTLIPVAATNGLVGEGIGDAVYRPTTIAELQETYSFGIGQLTVDLSMLELDDAVHSVDIDLGIGELIVIVPDDVGGMVSLTANAGEVFHQVPGNSQFNDHEGINVQSGTLTLPGDTGTMNLTIDVGLGSAELRLADG